MFSLSQTDVVQLVKEPNPAMKAETVARITADYNNNLFSEKENVIIFDILRLLVRDTALIVRKTIAESLKDNADVPHDIILTLANDSYTEVSEPILTFSKVLTNDDLISIVQRTASISKLLAIAERQHIPAVLATALIKRDIKQVSQAVIRNQTAEITEEAYEYLMNRYSNQPDFLKDMCARESLPMHIVENLFAVVSADIAADLAKRFPIDPKIITESIKKGREQVKSEKPGYNSEDNEKHKMIIQMGTTKTTPEDMNYFVTMLEKQKQLSPTLTLRTLCAGNLMMFTALIAKMASIPSEHARSIIENHTNIDPLEALCRKASLPSQLIPAILEITVKLRILSRENHRQSDISELLYESFKDRHDLPFLEQLLPLMQNT